MAGRKSKKEIEARDAARVKIDTCKKTGNPLDGLPIELDFGDPDFPVWMRQPGESERQYYYFQQYLAQERGERNLVTLSKTLKKALPYIRKLSMHYRWLRRAQAYDDRQDEIMFKAIEKERIEMTKRHVRMAMGMQAVGAHKLKLMQDAVKENKDVSELTIDDMCRMVELGCRLERLSRGEPTDVTKTDGAVTVVFEDVKAPRREPPKRPIGLNGDD